MLGILRHIVVAACCLLLVLTGASDKAVGGLIYFSSSDGQIYRAGLDGTGPEVVLPHYAYGLALDTDQQHIYFTQPAGYYDPELIKRANVDGTGVTTLVDVSATDDYPTSIALDKVGGYVYWTALRQGQVRRANLDGLGVTTLYAGQWYNHPDGLSLDVENGYMYWFDIRGSVSGPPTGYIVRSKLDGTEVTDLVGGFGAWWYGVTALDLEHGRIYFASEGGGTIQSAKLDGTDLTTVLDVGGVRAIALDVPNGHIYWGGSSGDEIRRANLDGSQVTTILDLNGNYPIAIALNLEPVPEPSSVAMLAGLLSIGAAWRRWRRKAV